MYKCYRRLIHVIVTVFIIKITHFSITTINQRLKKMTLAGNVLRARKKHVCLYTLRHIREPIESEGGSPDLSL